ncbi:MAG: hypothetical protein GX483_06805 [Actinomycetaceae bacterium]|nr:hypothetical protein [Actinomycetaceae bacterium]
MTFPAHLSTSQGVILGIALSIYAVLLIAGVSSWIRTKKNLGPAQYAQQRTAMLLSLLFIVLVSTFGPLIWFVVLRQRFEQAATPAETDSQHSAVSTAHPQLDSLWDQQ